jgi:hypothetical protein
MDADQQESLKSRRARNVFKMNRGSAFALFDFQGDDNFFAAVKARDGARGRFCTILFSVNFIVDIGVQAAEPVPAVVFGNVAPHLIATKIF